MRNILNQIRNSNLKTIGDPVKDMYYDRVQVTLKRRQKRKDVASTYVYDQIFWPISEVLWEARFRQPTLKIK